MKFTTDWAEITPYGKFIEVELKIDEGDVYAECDKKKLLDQFDREFVRDHFDFGE